MEGIMTGFRYLTNTAGGPTPDKDVIPYDMKLCMSEKCFTKNYCHPTRNSRSCY